MPTSQPRMSHVPEARAFYEAGIDPQRPSVRRPISALSVLSALVPIASAALLALAVTSVVAGFRIPIAVPFFALPGVIILSILIALGSRALQGRSRGVPRSRRRSEDGRKSEGGGRTSTADQGSASERHTGAVADDNNSTANDGSPSNHL